MKKTIKDAVDQYKSVYPQADRDGRECIAFTETYGWTMCFMDSEYLICTKQQFEDYVKEQKMEKQKYKYVNAGIKTVGELVDGLILKKEYFDLDGNRIDLTNRIHAIVDRSFTLTKFDCSITDITTRQPLPWYEQEGVFPCLVQFSQRYHLDVVVRYCDEFKVLLTNKGENLCINSCTPLTPTEAAKYGVECDYDIFK